jgi:NDP-sugar pyrophosphorylase family protein
MTDFVDLMAVILVGGQGTRLRSAVSNQPKVMAKVKDRPFLAFLLDYLNSSGIKCVVLCTGYLGNQIQTQLGNVYGNLQLVYSQESYPLGTAGALRLALPLLKSDPVLVMNGDSFCQANLKEFFAWHCAQKAEASLLLAQVSDTKRFGRVEIEAHGLICGFEEKNIQGQAGWINAGIYLLSRRLLLTIPDDRPASLEREIFPLWISRGLFGYQTQGGFLDIGTPEAYATAERFFASDAPQ